MSLLYGDRDEAEYAWVIDVDHIADTDEPEGGYLNAKGLVGPSDAPQALLDLLAEGKGLSFRIYDGDEELYYEGRWIAEGWTEGDAGTVNEVGKSSAYIASDIPEEAFGPLWDFGGPNAGATFIKYKGAHGAWGML
jgi:hypothetical protein